MRRARLYRDASDRLTLDLDLGYPSRDVDAGYIRQQLIEQFGATFGKSWEDPLGDAWAQAFWIAGHSFELFWDHWLGLRAISDQPSGDTVLERIGLHFTAHSPPSKLHRNQ
jgi:hypothetical protein